MAHRFHLFHGLRRSVLPHPEDIISSVGAKAINVTAPQLLASFRWETPDDAKEANISPRRRWRASRLGFTIGREIPTYGLLRSAHSSPRPYFPESWRLCLVERKGAPTWPSK